MAKESGTRPSNDGKNIDLLCETLAHINEISGRRMRSILNMVIDGVEVAHSLKAPSKLSKVSAAKVSQLIEALKVQSESIGEGRSNESGTTVPVGNKNKTNGSVQKSIGEVIENGVLLQRELDTVAVSALSLVIKMILATSDTGGEQK